MGDFDTKQVVDFIKTNGIHKFYLSKVWREKRAEILKRQHYECQECRQKGKATRAAVVHHVKHLKEFPELALNDDNLESVCRDCHNLLHPEKQRKFKVGKPKRWNDERW